MRLSALVLFSFIAFSNATASAAKFTVSADCINKLAGGENRAKQKLPKAALQEIAKGLGEQDRLQEDPVALLVDYTKSSKEKRAFMVDFKSCDVLSSDYVIHGGFYKEGKKQFKDGDPDHNGVLDACINRLGTRSNMTRPGLYRTLGCHKTNLENWTAIRPSGEECEGVKLVGLEKTNNDALGAGVVLHEHVLIKENKSVKPVGQGCPTFAPGRLKDLLQFGLLNDTLVYVYAPQCD